MPTRTSASLAFPLILSHKHSTLSSPLLISRQPKCFLTYGATPPLLLPFVISNLPISLVPLVPHGSPSPTSTGEVDQWTLLAHCSLTIVISPLDLSLSSLVLSPSPFKSNLKPYQRALLTPEQRSFFPLRDR